MNRDEILNTKETVNGLCKLARKLGYKDPCYQLINNDGSVVGDLLYMMEDNSGMIGAMLEWIADNYANEDAEYDEECDDCP